MNLYQRLNAHLNNTTGVIGRQPNKSVRYAILSDDLLTIVEETLIIMHKPCFNSARLINVNKDVKKRAVYIQNHGERGMLNIETTNYYFYTQADPKLPAGLIPPTDIK